MKLTKFHELQSRVDQTLTVLQWKDIDPKELESKETTFFINTISDGLEDIADEVVTEYYENFLSADKANEDKIKAFYKKNIADILDAMDKIDIDSFPPLSHVLLLVSCWYAICAVYRKEFKFLLQGGESLIPVEKESLCKKLDQCLIDGLEKLYRYQDKIKYVDKIKDTYIWVQAGRKKTDLVNVTGLYHLVDHVYGCGYPVWSDIENYFGVRNLKTKRPGSAKWIADMDRILSLN